MKWLGHTQASKHTQPLCVVDRGGKPLGHIKASTFVYTYMYTIEGEICLVVIVVEIERMVKASTRL